ncbi:MAG TPA: hypothetical protein GX513_00145 [Firmicutes bacterium]|nr:hypothetical protein [Bacillota bacterium]
MGSNGLDAFFAPRRIAVVGASRDPSKIGNIVFRYLRESEAQLFPVNPSAGEIMGHRCFPDLESIPGEIDLAVLAVPARATVETVRACVRKGVRAIIGQASGFGETGPEGRLLEEEIRNILSAVPLARRPRFLGPNTLGVYVPHRRLDTTFTVRERSPRPGPGGIAFISQSGATAICIMEAAAATGVGLSAFVGLGNKLDVQENELLDYFAEDPATRVITLYLESFADARGFLERCRRITPHKPIVVLKSGRTPTGMRAAALHTGSLAGSDRVVEGALRQVGVYRAYDEEEMVDVARALGYGKPLAGDRIAILTTAGGLGVIMTDLLEAPERGVGLHLATLSEGAKAKLRSLLVPFASVHNPVDMTANTTNDHYRSSLEILEAEAEVDAIFCVMQFQSPNVDEGLADIVVDYYRHGPKPMAVTTIGGELSQKGLQYVVRAGVPAYPSLWRAARALAALYSRGRFLADHARHTAGFHADTSPTVGSLAVSSPAVGSAPATVPEDKRSLPSPREAKGEISRLVRQRCPLAEHQVKDLLVEYGLPVPPRAVLPPAEDLSETLPFPYPVVVKVSDPNILHKTDIGALQLGIPDAQTLRQVIGDMRDRFAGKTLLVEAMEPAGVEAIVGLVYDPTFGPSLMFGLGGIFTELYADVSLRVIPVTRRDAEDMIDQVKAGRLFNGFRGRKASRQAMVEILLAVSRLGEELGEYIEQMDLNPVLVRERDAVVVDAKLTPRSDE